MGKRSTLTVRLSDETRERLERATVTGPYRITITSVLERGINLALAELEAITPPKADRGA